MLYETDKILSEIKEILRLKLLYDAGLIKKDYLKKLFNDEEKNIFEKDQKERFGL